MVHFRQGGVIGEEMQSALRIGPLAGVGALRDESSVFFFRKAYVGKVWSHLPRSGVGEGVVVRIQAGHLAIVEFIGIDNSGA